MRRYLNYVVSGVGMWLGKERDHDFVNLARIGVCTRIDQLAEGRFPGFEFVRQPQHGSGDGARFRSAKADDPYASPSWRRGDSDDGVIQMHNAFLILAGEQDG